MQELPPSLPASHLSSVFFHVRVCSCKTELYLFDDCSNITEFKRQMKLEGSVLDKLSSLFFFFFIFVSKQKCEERETSFFLGKWKSVHLNTQLAQLGFDPAHLLCDPRRQPVRLHKAQRGTSSPANFECCSCTLFKDWVFYRSKKLTWW